ncbi:ankyrin repeat-containing domain protein [Xylaria scruposa]|nr:ankyrin repeat-containing domain protein [Xylaria scruposa]
MTPQLTFDCLYLVSKEILAQANTKDVFNVSLISKSIHGFIYPQILKTEWIPYSSFLKHRHWSHHVAMPRSLKFFLETDNVKLVGSFLEHLDLDPNTVCHASPQCQTILCAAVRAGAVSVVEFLLMAGANARGDQHGGILDRPLKLAVENGSVSITTLLLKYRRLQASTEPKDPDKSNDRQKTENLQLLRYVEDLVHHPNGNAIVQKLLDYCSDVNQKNEYGFTVLHQVVRNEWPIPSPEIINSIIEAGVDVNALSDGEGVYGRSIRRTALNYASINARPSDIQALLEKGASAQGAAAFDVTRAVNLPRVGRSYGSQVPLIYTSPTPLHDLLREAHRYWEEQMVRAIDSRDCNSWVEGHSRWDTQKTNVYESIKVLIRHGLVGPQGLLDPYQNMIIDTSTVCAQLNFDYPELWSLLIQGGVLDAHRRNEFGQTFLNQLASRCCGKTLIRNMSWKPNLVRALIEAGSDPNTVDDSGMSPLHWGIFYNDFDLVKLLMELGADPTKEINGATPTHYAFGKPFARRGPIAHKIISALRRQLTKLLRDEAEHVRIEVYSQYRKREWHPVLSISSSLFLREKRGLFIKEAERQMYSIMALLSPFAEIVTDCNGNTPRDISESIGLLGLGDSLIIRPGQFHDIQKHSYPYHLAFSRTPMPCPADCPFCYSFPRQLLDIDTGKARPIPLTLMRFTTEDGQIVHLPAEEGRPTICIQRGIK